jgi:hypothetical protein
MLFVEGLRYELEIRASDGGLKAPVIKLYRQVSSYTDKYCDERPMSYTFFVRHSVSFKGF